MSLNYDEMCLLIPEIKVLITSKLLCGVEEISPRKVILTFKKTDNSHVVRLMVCFQEPFLRFHITSKQGGEPQSEFAQHLSASLVGTKLIGISLLNKDRILEFTFDKGTCQYRFISELFPKHVNSYIVDDKSTILFSLNRRGEKQHYVLPPKPVCLSVKAEFQEATSDIIESIYDKKEQDAAFHYDRGLVQQGIVKRIKKVERQLHQRRQELHRCHEWEKLHHEALLLQSNLYRLKRGMGEAVLEDWDRDGAEVRIALDPLLEPKDEVEKRFHAVKKLKRGLPFIEKQIHGIEVGLEEQRRRLEELDQVGDVGALALFCQKYRLEIHSKKRDARDFHKEEKAREVRVALPYKEFLSASGHKIWVGKGAADNEILTFQCARGLDWWLHVHGHAGSHVVICGFGQHEPDEETMKDALQLAIAYSKVKGKGEAEVLITQKKFVTRYHKGKKGQVHVSKHEVRHVRFDPERFERIKERSTQEK